MGDLKLGKLPAVRPYGLSDLDRYFTSVPPQPPAESPVPKVADWGMMGNATCGDCTIAGAGHLIAASDQELAERDSVPSQDQAIAEYSAITGYNPQTGANDTGCVEANVLSLWRSKGLFNGNKIAAYAPVDPKDVLAVHRAIAFLGQAYIGVALPQSAMQQFQDHEPWTVVKGSPILGGHCIVPVGYDPTGIYCVTWGAVAKVTWPWWVTYVDEVWAVVTQEIAEAGHGPSGLDLAALEADLDNLAA